LEGMLGGSDMIDYFNLYWSSRRPIFGRRKNWLDNTDLSQMPNIDTESLSNCNLCSGVIAKASSNCRLLEKSKTTKKWRQVNR
jgi:hypothetical protein